MGEQRTLWLGLAILAATSVASVAIGRNGPPFFGPDHGSIALGLMAGSVALGTIMYRGDRNPSVLFATTGIAIVVTQGAVGLLEWDDGSLGVPLLSGVPAILGAHAVLSSMLVLAAPRRERRGRPAPRPGRVVSGGYAAAVILIIVLALFSPDDTSMTVEMVTPVLAVGVFFFVTGIWLAANTRFGWWSAAAFSASVSILSLVLFVGVEPTFALLGISLRRASILCEGAFLFIGFLGEVHLESSRARRANDRAQEVLGGRAEIASMIAHEVRGPVATIKGLAATTSGSYDRLSDEERIEFVDLIHQEASRLLGIVDQTSLALKVDAGTLTMELRPHDLAAIVREAITAADARDHAITTNLAAGIVATVDRRWLGYAVAQGVDNAARFSPSGGPIAVDLRREGEGAIIEIADRGPGIPVERREEVFTRFVRWRPPGYEDRQGSGLGLFICRGICAEHGGNAVVDAAPEGGTMLRLTIPVTTPAMED